jgi:hypothetical protein
VRKFIDITGKEFNRLTVIRVNGRKNGQFCWLCECKCGKEVTVRGYCLRKGRTRSCGCYQPEATSRANTTHGQTKDYRISPEYASWCGMKERCLNPNNPQYKNYGGRGITVHPEWLDSFDSFISHIGIIPSDGKRYTLDRIDNEKNYTPGNVRWSDPLTQANNKRNNIKLTALGKTMTLPQWSRETGISIYIMRNRLLAGWNHEKIVTKKPRYRDSAPAKYQPFNWCG